MLPLYVLCGLLFVGINGFPQTIESRTSSVDLADSVAPSSGISDTKPQSENLDVKELITASYKGLSYVVVKNLSLGFVQAERYCAEELSEPMHLASVQSEAEWRMMTKVFGTPYPSELWLGGTVQRSNSRIFLLRWLDGVSFTYHKFPTTERRRWLSNWRVNSKGCMVGNFQNNGLGNWTAELTPCTENRAFVCKEKERPVSGPLESMIPQSMLTFRQLINGLLVPPALTPFRVQGFHYETRRTPSRFQIYGNPTNPTEATSVAPTTERTTMPTTTDVPETTTVSSITTEATQPVNDQQPSGSITTDAPATDKLTQPEGDLSQRYEPNIANIRTKFPNRPTFSVIPPNSGDTVTQSGFKNGNELKVPGVPGVTTQVIYPNTIWDLTYPDEPKWLTERKLQGSSK